MCGSPLQERRRPARREQRIELTVAEHVYERLMRFERLEVQARDRLERRALVPARLLLAAVAPMDLVGLHAVFVLQHAAHPDHGRDLVFGQADALAAQVLRLVDAGVGAHIDAGMPEQPRHERRDADVLRRARGDRADVARERHLRDVEFLELEQPVEDLLRIERQVVDVAALDLHPAVDDRLGAIVVAAGDRYRHVGHGSSWSVFGCCRGSKGGISVPRGA